MSFGLIIYRDILTRYVLRAYSLNIRPLCSQSGSKKDDSNISSGNHERSKESGAGKTQTQAADGKPASKSIKDKPATKALRHKPETISAKDMPVLQLPRDKPANKSEESKLTEKIVEGKQRAKAADVTSAKQQVKTVDDNLVKKVSIPRPDGRNIVKKLRTAAEAESKARTGSINWSEKLSDAVRNAAREVSGDDTDKVENDLLAQLKKYQQLTVEQRQGQQPATISNELSNVRVPKTNKYRRNRILWSKEEKSMDNGEAVPVSQLFSETRVEKSGRRRQKDEMTTFEGDDLSVAQPAYRQKRDRLELKSLLSAPPLGIFTKKYSTEDTAKDASSVQSSGLFETLEAEELARRMTFPDRNAFEEMIRWTKQGRMWKFPIDNEQGLDEESKVGFNEHVFLDHLLEGFPASGPVRHFMEMVIVGLSKNPYLTVEQKHGHVAWFKEYFDNKKQLLEEMMARVETRKLAESGQVSSIAEPGQRAAATAAAADVK